LWYPVYWLSGAVKAMTAIVSAYTAFVLVRLIPQALAIPSPAQLAAANLELQQQIQARLVVEAQIQQLNEELEAKVAQRTQELVDTTLQAKDLAERLNLSIDAARLGTWDWNLLTDEIAWNDYCVVLLDDPGAATYTYHDWEGRVHPDDLAGVLAALEVAKTTYADYAAEYRVVRSDGSWRWLSGFGRFYRDRDQRPVRMAGVLSDITDRKQSQAELDTQALELLRANALAEQRNQELDRFSYIVSHDLKAPLRGIANLAQWIEDDLTDIDPDTQANLELLRSRVYRMEAMINGLLDYARLGNLPSSLENFAVEDLLAEVVDSLNIPDTFKLDLPSHLPPITTNRLLLGRVLANLIGNAYKHHDRPKGTIRVTARPLGNVWEFTVADDGAGIPAESRERIFDIFQTLSTKDKNNTGIGLSIVKRIVENQEGEIEIVERAEDSARSSARGVTFRFTWVEPR
ncbi:MAG: PAS domain-containing protein, partial [Chamaesiphon sp.]|nr:PAS domain-containing protein [Chamaesiphon sp.]